MDRSARTCFDAVAELYDRARPAPPAELVEAMLELGGLRPGDRVLEVGCGTGQATRPLAESGLAVEALELGPALAALARERLADCPAVRVLTADFERWTPPRRYDAVVSVQAFHWIGPERGLPLAAAALRPGGSLLLAWHLDRSRESAFYRDTDPVYDRYFAARPPTARPSPDGAALRFEVALAAAPEFDALRVRRAPWLVRLPTAGYLELLRTFSDVRSLAAGVRERFLADIAAVAERHGGVVERRYESVLLAARLRAGTAETAP